jgi:hypothetical protein
MSIEENKAMVQRIWEGLLNAGKTENMNELIAIDYVYHGPGGHEIKGIEGLKKFIPRKSPFTLLGKEEFEKHVP